MQLLEQQFTDACHDRSQRDASQWLGRHQGGRWGRTPVSRGCRGRGLRLDAELWVMYHSAWGLLTMRRRWRGGIGRPPTRGILPRWTIFAWRAQTARASATRGRRGSTRGCPWWPREKPTTRRWPEAGVEAARGATSIGISRASASSGGARVARA